MKRLILVSIAVLCSCSHQENWKHDNMAEMNLKHDLATCRYEAQLALASYSGDYDPGRGGHRTSVITLFNIIDEHSRKDKIIRSCMELKGYYLPTSDNKQSTVAMTKPKPEPSDAKKQKPTKYDLYEYSQKIAPKLPITIDKDRQITSIIGWNNKLTMVLKMVNLSVDTMNVKEFVEKEYKEATNSCCTTPDMRTFIDGGVVLEANYYDKDSKYITSVTLSVKDCENKQNSNP